jgi:hypothetical protein
MCRTTFVYAVGNTGTGKLEVGDDKRALKTGPAYVIK